MLDLIFTFRFQSRFWCRCTYRRKACMPKHTGSIVVLNLLAPTRRKTHSRDPILTVTNAVRSALVQENLSESRLKSSRSLKVSIRIRTSASFFLDYTEA